MNHLDDELRSALRREEPPQGFAERLMSRIAAAPVRPSRWERLLSALRLPGLPKLGWVAAAVCLVLLGSALEYRRQQRVKAEGKAARAQVMLALRMASTKLNVALREAKLVNRPGGARPLIRKQRPRTEHL